MFHIEHFIEGKYIKYNSNSGYIHLDDTLRATPQVEYVLAMPTTHFDSLKNLESFSINSFF